MLRNRFWIQSIGKGLVRLFLLIPILISLLFIGQYLGIATSWSAGLALILWLTLALRYALSNSVYTAIALAGAAILGYFWQQPSLDRDWKPEIARLPKLVITGDRLDIQHLRDFRWYSAETFEERWISASFDLSLLDSLDVIVVPFGDSEQLAHVMLSFGFSDGRHLALSVETRPERGESYSLMGGAARQLELIYLFGTEADLLGLRILHRGNRVYCYPLDASPTFIRNLLTDLCYSAQKLNDEPRFYATLRHNCTTTLLRHVNRVHSPRIKVEKEVLFPARIGELLYRIGYLDTDRPWEEAKESFRVDQRITTATQPNDFSRTLRSKAP